MSLWARRASIGTFRPVPEGMFPETRLPERGPLGNSPQLAIAPSYTSRTSGTGESRRVLHGARYSYADGYELQRTGAEGEPPAPRKSRSPDKDPGHRHDVTPWTHHNRVPLCQATLSIGPYLLLKVQFQHHFFTQRYPSLKPKSWSTDKEPRPFLIHPIAEKGCSRKSINSAILS